MKKVGGRRIRREGEKSEDRKRKYHWKSSDIN